MTVGRDVLNELVDYLEADFLVRFLPTAEAELNAHFHIIAQELDRMIALGCQIMRVDYRRNLNLLHLARSGPDVRLFFRFLVQEFAVIQNSAHGRRRMRHDFDQVELFALGEAKRIVEGHHTQLLFIVIDNPDFARANLPIAAMQRFSGTK